MSTTITRRHGGPYDRGAADAYYGRTARPHKFEGPSYHGPRIETLTPAEVEAYTRGYEEQDDRKDWE